MNYKLIKDMVVDEQLEQICLVAQVEAKTTKTGKPFVKVTIKDSSGSLPINIWQTNAEDVSDLKVGVFAVFKIKIEDFKGSKSASATLPMIVKAPDDMTPYQNQHGLTDQECDTYYQILLDGKKKVVNPYIKAYLDMLFDDQSVKDGFCNSPASVSNRGAYRGGLVEHVAKVLLNAEYLIKTQSIGHINAKIDVDIVIAGILMHDFGKMFAYEIDTNGMAKTTRKGMLLEHLPMSYSLSNMAFYKTEIENHFRIPEEIKDHINHCILSHHGKLEYGSPVTPRSVEAQIVHMADMADSTTSNYAEPTKANAASVDANGFVDGSRFSNRQLFVGTQNV